MKIAHASRVYERLTIEEVEARIKAFPWTRQITSFHLHHTADRHASWPGVDGVHRTYLGHMRRKMVDLAMHVIVDPFGVCWIGRDWNARPASAQGHNGTAAAGPFMIECWGDFRHGYDPWAGDQKEAAERLCAAICIHAGLNPMDPPAVIGHREIDKTACPGDIDLDEFEQSVARLMAAAGEEIEAPRALAKNIDHPPEITPEMQRRDGELSTQRVVQAATLTGGAATGLAGVFKVIPPWAMGVLIVGLVLVGSLWALRSLGIIKRSA